ncbi:hypothetical protein HDU93_008868 [Gonapodya sp. JEL0774]|nr:hypothetical protein HDU93_008868 [Gonapodya sp. JEL0774]
MVRYVLWAAHVCREEREDGENSPKQNLERLQRFLKSLMEIYDDNLGPPSPNEAEFRAYHLLLFPNETNLTTHGERRWRPEVFFSPCVQRAVELTQLAQFRVPPPAPAASTTRVHDPKRYIAQGQQGNAARFFEIVKDEETDVLVACLAEMQFDAVRAANLLTVARSTARYKTAADGTQRMDEWGVDEVEDMWGMDPGELEENVERGSVEGVEVAEKEGRKVVRFGVGARGNFLRHRNYSIVESKRRGISDFQLILGVTRPGGSPAPLMVPDFERKFTRHPIDLTTGGVVEGDDVAVAPARPPVKLPVPSLGVARSPTTTTTGPLQPSATTTSRPLMAPALPAVPLDLFRAAAGSVSVPGIAAQRNGLNPLAPSFQMQPDARPFGGVGMNPKPAGEPAAVSGSGSGTFVPVGLFRQAVSGAGTVTSPATGTKRSQSGDSPMRHAVNGKAEQKSHAPSLLDFPATSASPKSFQPSVPSTSTPVHSLSNGITSATGVSKSPPLKRLSVNELVAEARRIADTIVSEQVHLEVSFAASDALVESLRQTEREDGELAQYSRMFMNSVRDVVDSEVITPLARTELADISLEACVEVFRDVMDMRTPFRLWKRRLAERRDLQMLEDDYRSGMSGFGLGLVEPAEMRGEESAGSDGFITPIAVASNSNGDASRKLNDVTSNVYWQKIDILSLVYSSLTARASSQDEGSTNHSVKIVISLPDPAGMTSQDRRRVEWFRHKFLAEDDLPRLEVLETPAGKAAVRTLFRTHNWAPSEYSELSLSLVIDEMTIQKLAANTPKENPESLASGASLLVFLFSTYCKDRLMDFNTFWNRERTRLRSALKALPKSGGVPVLVLHCADQSSGDSATSPSAFATDLVPRAHAELQSFQKTGTIGAVLGFELQVGEVNDVSLAVNALAELEDDLSAAMQYIPATPSLVRRTLFDIAQYAFVSTFELVCERLMDLITRAPSTESLSAQHVLVTNFLIDIINEQIRGVAALLADPSLQMVCYPAKEFSEAGETAPGSEMPRFDWNSTSNLDAVRRFFEDNVLPSMAAPPVLTGDYELSEVDPGM